MAEKRMFSQKVVGSDAFLEMPAMAQILYFHLNMNADDEGFVNSPKKIARSIGASDEDLTTLINKRFLIRFPSGIVVIKHWKINNSIRQDRIRPTEYQVELSMLIVKENKSYTEKEKHPELLNLDEKGNDDNMSTKRQPTVNQMSGQSRGGENRVGENRDKNREKGEKSSASNDLKHPTLEEIKEFCTKRNSSVDPQRFYDFYEAGQWIDSKGNPVTNWQQKLMTWERTEHKKDERNTATGQPVSGKVSGNTPRSRWGPSEYKCD